ncbi:MAG: RNA-binding protein [Clostridia bacterium]|nr:RNA-binding protein [Clostridia bacterium]
MLVYSKAGRDKKNLFLVLDIENDYAYIADGDMRKAEKPKKKKLIHLQKINKVFEDINKDISNSEIRKIIAQHKPI